ncbi:DNA primase large subunit PriL [Candidatus Bathyarchaeota archaeon]|nr:DNA primase large subunit PriL [Candidatus Bathyarchaeota archaeon]
MQTVFSKLAKNDYAKYPFLKDATKYVKTPNLKIEDLEDPSLEKILNRAEQRVKDAILYNTINKTPHFDEDIELMSFPIAIILAVATKNAYIQKRYALAEAKRATEDLKKEPKEKILKIAQNFEWKLDTTTSEKIPGEFSLKFTDYLRNITHLQTKEWKLVNHILLNGNIHLTKDETARLLQEEIRKHIEKRLEIKELPNFPPKIIETAEKIKKLAAEKIGKAEMEGFPEIISQSAFPPCINALYEAISKGRHLSHVGRFTLTSFLVNIGMSPDKVIELFKNFSDYNDRMTRYQVEHIAGERGSRTHYKPPKCTTLQTHGVCTNSDKRCKKIRNPLGYYKNKLESS